MGNVIAVSRSQSHRFSKPNQISIRLLKGLGVEGDAHMGETVKHRHLVLLNPFAANRRQVHLIHGELLDELASAGFTVHPGELGENITTRGLDLLKLPTGSRLHIGRDAVVEVTGLRKPCSQIDKFQSGLLAQVVDKSPGGRPVFKSGVMGVVLQEGDVAPGDEIVVELPPEPHRPLEKV